MTRAPKSGKWTFKLFTVGRVPPRIGRGQDRDPIYPALSNDAFTACIEYYRECEQFLEGERRTKPDIRPLLKRCIPHGAIFRARLGARDEYGEKLLLWIEDLDIPQEKRTCGPRWLPSDYLPGFLLLTAAGGSLRHNYTRKKDKEGNLLPRNKRRSHLSFGRGRDQNVRVLRIMNDADPGSQVHRAKSSAAERHREYRPKALVSRHDEEATSKFGRAGYGAKGRASAFQIAAQHWEIARQRGETLPDPEMTSDDLVKLLSWTFGIADRMYCLPD